MAYVDVQTATGTAKVHVCDYCKTVCIPSSSRFCSGRCAGEFYRMQARELKPMKYRIPDSMTGNITFEWERDFDSGPIEFVICYTVYRRRPATFDSEAEGGFEINDIQLAQPAAFDDEIAM